MAFSDSVGDLAKKVASFYEELVTTRVRFEELRNRTNETLLEFKHVIERFEMKLNEVEKEHVKTQAQLLAKIDGLEQRLTMLSEKALHVAVKEAATQVARELLGSDKVEQVASPEVLSTTVFLPPKNDS
jgi:hypothetical protein